MHAQRPRDVRHANDKVFAVQLGLGGDDAIGVDDLAAFEEGEVLLLADGMAEDGGEGVLPCLPSISLRQSHVDHRKLREDTVYFMLHSRMGVPKIG